MFLSSRVLAQASLLLVGGALLSAQSACPTLAFETQTHESVECEAISIPEGSAVVAIYGRGDNETHLEPPLEEGDTVAFVQAGDSCTTANVGLLTMSTSTTDGQPLQTVSHSMEFDECSTTCCPDGYIVTSVFGEAASDSWLEDLSSGGQCARVRAGDSCNGQIVGAVCAAVPSHSMVSYAKPAEECRLNCCEEGEVVGGLYSVAASDSYIVSIEEGGRCADIKAGSECNSNGMGMICIAGGSSGQARLGVAPTVMANRN